MKAQSKQVWQFILDREVEAPARFCAIQTHRASIAVLYQQVERSLHALLLLLCKSWLPACAVMLLYEEGVTAPVAVAVAQQRWNANTVTRTSAAGHAPG